MTTGQVDNDCQTTMDTTNQTVEHLLSGVFTRRQLRQAGWSRCQVAYQAKHGSWQPVAGKAWCLSQTRINHAAAAKAAVLTWADGVIWGPSALQLWIPDAPVPKQDNLTVAITIYRRAQVGLRPHHTRLLPEEITGLGGIRVQELQSAIVDTLRDLPLEQAKELFAWLLTRGHIIRHAFVKVASRRKGWRGALRLNYFKDEVLSNAASIPELDCHDILRQSLAMPTGWSPNKLVRALSGEAFCVDVLVEELGKIVEIDGAAYHQPGLGGKDERRDRLLREAGFDVLRLTAIEVMYNKPATIEKLVEFLYPAAKPAHLADLDSIQLPKPRWWHRHTHHKPKSQPRRRRSQR